MGNVANRGLIVLAGGLGERFGGNKALVMLEGKPLLRHVLDRVINLSEEVAVVIRDSYEPQRYQPYAAPGVRIVKDSSPSRGPLVGIATGLSELSSSYVCILSCDLPLVNRRTLEYLFSVARNHDAAIPVWPNGRMEALHAVYERKAARKAAQSALAAGELRNTDMIKRLRSVVYVPVADLKRYDARLLTFRNVNTRAELRRVLSTLTALRKAESTGVDT